MKKNRVLRLLATSALIIGYQAPAFALDPYFPTWYIGLRGSGSALEASDLGTYPLPETDYDPGFGAGASIGFIMPQAWFQPLSGLRFEAEVSRYWNHIDNGRKSAPPGLIMDSNDSREFTLTTYMANAYYTLPVDVASRIRPYIGGGYGIVEAKLDSEPVATITNGKYDDAVRAWQGMVGLMYQENPDAISEWNLGYRYLQADDITMDDGFGGKTILETEIHSVELGVRFRL